MSTQPLGRSRTEVAPQGETVVQFLDVWKRYGAREVLAGVNLKIRRGEVLCILGPSGTGKSVALRHINGLTKPALSALDDLQANAEKGLIAGAALESRHLSVLR